MRAAVRQVWRLREALRRLDESRRCASWRGSSRIRCRRSSGGSGSSRCADAVELADALQQTIVRRRRAPSADGALEALALQCDELADDGF